MTSLWFKSALLPSGWAEDVRVSVSAGLVASIATGVAVSSGDESYALAIPGLCNVHSHGFQRGMAGLTERRSAKAGDNFWTWREIMYRFLGTLTPDDVEAITAQAYVEMLEGGFTRVGEFHYLHHDPSGVPYADLAEMAARIVSAAEATGIGLTLMPVFYAHSDFGGAPPADGQKRFITDVDGFERLFEASARYLKGDTTIALAIHSLRAATPSEIAAILAAHHKGPVHIHAAEQTREVEVCSAKLGARPVEWLLDKAGVDERWCLIHATHMTDQEATRLAASGAVAGLCPITEANLGDGIFPAQSYLAEGGRIGIGTDSNVLIDAAQELRAVEYAQRLARRARALLGAEAVPSVGRRLFDAAVSGGAQALGATSGITVGHSADIVSLNRDHPSLAGHACDNVLDGWIFGVRGQAIDSVWRRGEKVVAGGRHRNADQIAARYRATLVKLVS